MNREGQKVGTLTVIKDEGNAQITCKCDCGREGPYPREIFKPSYKGPKSCPWCLGNPCEECGVTIPYKGRMRAATCSDTCRDKRKARREKERYQRVKDTDHFRQVRAEYLARLEQRKAEDPVFAEKLRRSRLISVRRWRKAINADPAKRKAYLEAHRQRERKRLARIKQNPARYNALLERMRNSYRSLSEEEYEKRYGRQRSGRRRSRYNKAQS